MNFFPWRNKQNETELAEREYAPTLQRVRSEIDRMFDRFFQDPLAPMSDVWPGMSQWGPTLDMTETDNDVVLKVELPGVDPKDVDVTIANNVLTIKGEKKETTEHKGESVYHSERRFGSFRRSIQLPGGVDGDKVSAEHANGVLTIKLDKSPTAMPKRITVKAN